MILVSIIIAAYNIAPYITRCMESVLGQSLENIEIIVVDDGSTDETPQILHGLLSDSRVHIIHHRKNQGLAVARKTGLDVARGEYVWFVDGDDWINPESAKTLYQRAKESSCDILCFGMFIEKDRQEIEQYIPEDFGELNNDEYLFCLLTGKIPPCVFCKFIRQSYIIKIDINLPQINCGEDLALSVAASMGYPKVSVFAQAFIHYCMRQDSLSIQASQNLLDIDLVFKFVRSCLEKTQQYKKYQKEFEYYAFMHCIYYKYHFIFQQISQYSQQLYEIWQNMKIDLNENDYIVQALSDKIPKDRVLKNLNGKNYQEAMNLYFIENGII